MEGSERGVHGTGQRWQEYDLVIDAVFGFSFRSDGGKVVREPYGSLLSALRDISPTPLPLSSPTTATGTTTATAGTTAVLSVDVPSG